MRRRELLALIGTAPLLAPLGALEARAPVRAPGPPGRGAAADEVAAALADAGAAPPRGARLVLVELAGANDGLNTLVPWRDERYRAARPTLALAREGLLEVGEGLGLHGALRALGGALEGGELALVQGLGYPRPNRSHFRSTALRERAGDGHRDDRRDGWLVHAVEHGLRARAGDVDGISLAGGQSLFASDGGRWLSAGSVAQLLAPRAAPTASVADLDNANASRIAERVRTLDAMLAALRAKLERAPEEAALEGAELGEQLRQVLRFVAAGVDVPVFRVRLDGFDTHEGQTWRHADRLRTLAAALAGFRARLIALGEWRSTTIMTYSEFGRRLAENASGGTDHGTAAPQLVLGGRVRGGLYGAPPDLAAEALIEGDPVHTMDYRALYGRALEGALGVGDAHLAGYADARLDALLG